MRATFFINRRYNLGIYLNVIRGASLKQKFAYILFLWGVLALPSAVQAIGLGEPGQEPVLGQRLDLSIPLLGVGQSLPDASCFRVVKPRAAGDLPWLRQADIQVVAGSVPRLRLRSDVVREPLFQIAIDLGCGNDLYREYTLLANPVLAEAPPPVQAAPEVVEKPPRQSKKRERSEARRAPASAEDNAIETEQSARARGVEDMPRIVAGLTKQWASPEVLVYMQQLLRDNRAGQRQGFPLPVVEEILFLIELKETALNMERELTEA